MKTKLSYLEHRPNRSELSWPQGFLLALLVSAIVSLVLIAVLMPIAAIGETAPGAQPVHHTRILITDAFECLQFEPIANVEVFAYVYREESPFSPPDNPVYVWHLFQLAGPWGNSALGFNDEYQLEFDAAFAEIQRALLWRGGYLPEYEWSGETLDYRGWIANLRNR